MGLLLRLPKTGAHQRTEKYRPSQSSEHFHSSQINFIYTKKFIQKNAAAETAALVFETSCLLELDTRTDLNLPGRVLEVAVGVGNRVKQCRSRGWIQEIQTRRCRSA